MTSTISGRALAAAASMAFACALSLAWPTTARAASFDYQTRGPLTFSGIPPADPVLQGQLARYAFGQGTRFLEWLPKGMLVAERSGAQVRLDELSAPLGQSRTWAVLGLPLHWARARGDTLAFVQSVDGRQQLFVQTRSGPARQLTQGDMLRGAPRWAPDGRSLAFYGSGPTGAEGAVYIQNLAKGALPRLVLGALPGRWRLLDWSAGHWLLADITDPDHTVLYLADVEHGTREKLAVPAARIVAARFAPDGAAIYLISDQDGEFEQLFRFDLRTQTLQRVSRPIDWDVEQFAVSADGRYIAYTVNDDGLSLLTVTDNRLQLSLPVPWLRGGVIGHMSFGADHRLAVSYQSALQPPAVYVYDADHRTLERWTAPALTAASGPPVIARLIHYPTWDRTQGDWRMISAYAYLPAGSASGAAPVLILLHSGVASQFRPSWRPFIQFVVNTLGFAVIAPNVRGSSGYGKTFRALADGRQRDDAVRDVGSLLVWIGLQPGLDVRRTVLMGRGYGGWLAVSSLATFDGHLLGVIDVDGIADLADYVRQAPAGRLDARIAAFGDPDDPSTAQFLRRISPLGEVARIRRPMLIVQGLRGAGAQAADARQFAYLLRYHRVPVWLLTASDAGNGFCPPADRAALRLTVAQFLQSLIRGGGGQD